MAKKYRISVFNRTTRQRELIYGIFTSKKQAESMANAMNKVDVSGEVQAYVVVQEKKHG